MPAVLAESASQVSISTYTETFFQGGDIPAAISQIIQRKASGQMTLNVSQGGIQSLKWVEKTNGQK